MSLDPIEFTLGTGDTQLLLRHTPLPGIPLAREHHKLLMRVDMESGALDTLAFTFTQEDYAEMMSFSAGGVFRLIKTLSMLLGNDPAVGVLDDEDADDAAGQAAHRDSLPREVSALCLYYAKLGNVEVAVNLAGNTRWAPMQSEDDFNALPQQVAIYMCAWQVLRGLFIPFADLFPTFAAKVKAQSSGNDSANSEQTTEPTAPTLETPSST